MRTPTPIDREQRSGGDAHERLFESSRLQVRRGVPNPPGRMVSNITSERHDDIFNRRRELFESRTRNRVFHFSRRAMPSSRRSAYFCSSRELDPGGRNEPSLRTKPLRANKTALRQVFLRRNRVGKSETGRSSPEVRFQPVARGADARPRWSSAAFGKIRQVFRL